MCVDDRDKAALRGNWFVSQYAMPMISIVECKNTTENGNFCKSPKEIKQFLNDHYFFFIHQFTLIEADKYDDSYLVDEFPNNGDKASYFPLSRQQKSIDYGPIYGVMDKGPSITEVHFQLNKLTILDSPTPTSAADTRSTEFINISKIRHLQIDQTHYHFTGTEERILLKCFLLAMSHNGLEYTRTIRQAYSEVALIGANVRNIFFLCFYMALYFI